jgi:hypothetical protein
VCGEDGNLSWGNFLSKQFSIIVVVDLRWRREYHIMSVSKLCQPADRIDTNQPEDHKANDKQQGRKLEAYDKNK